MLSSIMGFLTILLMNKLNVWSKMLTNKINSILLHPVNKHISNFFYHNQMHYNYKSDERIMKTLIHKNILPTDPNKKIKLIIYYNKFKTSNLVIRNNSTPSIGVLQKTNVIYKFKSPLGDCISDNNNIYVGLTSTTLSSRLTMHLFDTSSIAQHLKTFMPNYEKFSPTTQQYSNIKIINKNFRFLKHYILETCNQHLIELIFKPVLMYLNVFSYWHYLQNYI